MLETLRDIFGFSAIICAAILSVYVICIFICTPKVRGRMIVILPCGDSNDCARFLYSAHLRLALFAGCCESEVIAVDTGMNSEQRKICEDVCRKYCNTLIFTPQELTTYLSKDEV